MPKLSVPVLSTFVYGSRPPTAELYVHATFTLILALIRFWYRFFSGGLLSSQMYLTVNGAIYNIILHCLYRRRGHNAITRLDPFFILLYIFSGFVTIVQVWDAKLAAIGVVTLLLYLGFIGGFAVLKDGPVEPAKVMVIDDEGGDQVFEDRLVERSGGYFVFYTFLTQASAIGCGILLSSFADSTAIFKSILLHAYSGLIIVLAATVCKKASTKQIYPPLLLLLYLAMDVFQVCLFLDPSASTFGGFVRLLTLQSAITLSKNSGLGLFVAHKLGLESKHPYKDPESVIYLKTRALVEAVARILCCLCVPIMFASEAWSKNFSDKTVITVVGWNWTSESERNIWNCDVHGQAFNFTTHWCSLTCLSWRPESGEAPPENSFARLPLFLVVAAVRIAILFLERYALKSFLRFQGVKVEVTRNDDLQMKRSITSLARTPIIPALNSIFPESNSLKFIIIYIALHGASSGSWFASWAGGAFGVFETGMGADIKLPCDTF